MPVARTARTALLLGAAATALAGCRGRGGVAGTAGGPVPSTTVAAAGPGGTDPSPFNGPTTSAPDPAAASTSRPSPTASAPPAAGGALRLGGDDLGVTRVGAPFRPAVALVSATLGRPTGDPPPDTSCLGAEDETSWGTFRLASSGGLVSGWVSTSRTLATPAGVTVGTTLAALRLAYGAGLQLPPPAPDSATIFLVPAARLGGVLTGATASASVSSLFNGTCESQ